jgi:hypothetical protein
MDELSGSGELKPQCDDYRQKIAACDEDIKASSDNLHRLRLEKVK